MVDRSRLTSKPSDGDISRRSRYGVGPTVRYSADAHEIIMGPEVSPHPPRSSSLAKPVKSTTQASFASRLSRPTAASAARAAESKKFLVKPLKTTPTKASPSATSVVRSLVSTSSKNNERSSVTPTPTSLPKSSTVTSFKKAGKGLKSRFSNLISGRRRNNVYSVSKDTKGYTAINEEDTIVDSELDLMLHKPNRASRLLTTYNNSGMDAGSSDNVRTTAQGPFMGEMSDKVTSSSEQQRHERDEKRVRTAALSFGALNNPAAAPATHRLNQGDGEEPPTPPPTRGGPAGHYGDDNEENEMAEDEFDRYLEGQLNAAERHLNEAIAAADGAMDAANVANVSNVVRALGESILAARQAHMAGIQLRAATTNLIEFTAHRAANAHQAIADAAAGVSGGVSGGN